MQVINAENLSKQYVLGSRQPNSVREFLTGMFSRSSEARHTIWALRDVSFSVNDGETLGLIGHNGAGKSTLLKILSRITKPTLGRATIRGRVGSLLEVGTGFHGELTGRENIYMNGAILGMKHAEIKAKFDEIVAFSEIEEFLDTPVKHYSSGMYMRLAFSVAAHLDPEILIVDEVLAVGDVSFQKKCLRKMRAVGESGRTVIFVSHDMSAINRLCRRAIWIAHGAIETDGPAGEVVAAYLNEQSEAGAQREWREDDLAPGSDLVKLRRVRVCDETGSPISSIDIRHPVYVEMTYDVLRPGGVLVPNFHFYNEHRICLFVSQDLATGWRSTPRPVGTFRSRICIPGNFLAAGTVFVTAAISTFQPLEIHVDERDVVAFHVMEAPQGDGERGDYTGVLPGVVRPTLEWETNLLPDN